MKLNWLGWEPECGQSKAEWFNETDPSRYCDMRCEECGFSYLDENGKQHDTEYFPGRICGVI